MVWYILESHLYIKFCQQNVQNKQKLFSAHYLTGGLSFFTQPLGSLFSGWICKPFGRRPALFIVNIPYSIALLTLYNASQVWHIFLANILIGIAVGLMEVPAITYIGEIA